MAYVESNNTLYLFCWFNLFFAFTAIRHLYRLPQLPSCFLRSTSSIDLFFFLRNIYKLVSKRSNFVAAVYIFFLIRVLLEWILEKLSMQLSSDWKWILLKLLQWSLLSKVYAWSENKIWIILNNFREYYYYYYYFSRILVEFYYFLRIFSMLNIVI